MSRRSVQETLGPIARMAPGWYVLSLSHSYVDYVLGRCVLSFESYPRTLRIARSVKKFFVRGLRNFVRGLPVRGYRAYVRGLKNTIEWHIKLLLRSNPFT